MLKENHVPNHITNYDSMLVLAHFKGHPMGGYGGALKNIGMGGGSRAGKMEMHAKGKPHVITSKCVGCGRCAKECPASVIEIREESV